LIVQTNVNYHVQLPEHLSHEDSFKIQ